MRHITTLKMSIRAGVFICTLFPQVAQAQNTAGVFASRVVEDHKSFQYRSTVNPDDANDQTGFAQRLHYQQSINGDLMWRIIGQTKKTDRSDIDFDFVQAELYWELTNDEDKHYSALRFDARYRNDQRPGILGVNWGNQFQINDNWSLRSIILSSIEVGEIANNGVNLQTRAQLGHRLKGNKSVGVELYSFYGRTGDIGSFNDQVHTIAPYISLPLNRSTSIFGGPLIGLSDTAPDFEARLWITQKLF